jgi:hypothetical protein
MYTKINMFLIFYMECTVSLVFTCVFTAETCAFGTFHMYTKIHMYHIFYMKSTVLLLFYVFSLCFHRRNIYFWYILHVNTKPHIYHVFYMKCTVFLVFSCVFTVFLLQKHVLLVHFTCIYQNSHVPYILHHMHSFASVFMCLHFRNMYFWYILHVYTRIHMYHIFYIKCTVLLVFLCVFTAEICTLGIFHMYTRIHMYHIYYMKCTVLLVFLLVFTVFLLQKHVLLVHFTCIPKYTCTIYFTWNAQFSKCFHVFLLCLHCRNMYFWYISHVYQNTHVP